MKIISMLSYRSLAAMAIIALMGCAQQPTSLDGVGSAQESVTTKPDGQKEATVGFENAPFLGNKDAPVTVVEFTDYQCGQCGRHAGDALKGIVKDFVNTGKVKYVVRDYPGEKFHKNAFKAAEATHCAGEQGNYWEMHDRLLANQGALAIGDLPDHAAALGLNLPEFAECLASGKFEARIRKDMASAERIGLSGTPYIVYGLTDPDSTTVTGKVVPGTSEYIVFKNRLNALLAPSTQK